MPYKSWCNLKREGQIEIFDAQDNSAVKTILAENYNFESLMKALENKLDKEGLKVPMNSWKGALEISNPQNKKSLYRLPFRQDIFEEQLTTAVIWRQSNLNARFIVNGTAFQMRKKLS